MVVTPIVEACTFGRGCDILEVVVVAAGCGCRISRASCRSSGVTKCFNSSRRLSSENPKSMDYESSQGDGRKREETCGKEGKLKITLFYLVLYIFQYYSTW